jgi:hypothetical protein
MATVPQPTEENRGPIDRLATEIAIQAELLALNFALEGDGAEQASEALYALSRELRQAARFAPRTSAGPRAVIRPQD